jgi:RNA polymerase sigma-70 factor, ECF subfamily
MINVEQHINPIERAALSLTTSVFMADTHFVFLAKGRPMDETSMLSNISHDQLVSMVAHNKDRTAFKILFEYYAPRLKSYLLNFKIADQKAEDLAQEVMLTLWQKAEKFDPDKAKISTWLFRVARNKYIDQFRKQKYPEVNADDHVALMVAPEKTDQNLEEQQVSDRIQKAMKTLKEEQRKVIELSFYKELSHSQIAEETGLPLGTVKSKIRMAFQTLRKELGDYQ